MYSLALALLGLFAGSCAAETSKFITTGEIIATSKLVTTGEIIATSKLVTTGEMIATS